jgi:hypothetical protein
MKHFKLDGLQERVDTHAERLRTGKMRAQEKENGGMRCPMLKCVPPFHSGFRKLLDCATRACAKSVDARSHPAVMLESILVP